MSVFRVMVALLCIKRTACNTKDYMKFLVLDFKNFITNIVFG